MHGEPVGWRGLPTYLNKGAEIHCQKQPDAFSISTYIGTYL